MNEDKEMIRVKVLPPPGCDRSVLDEKCWVCIPDGSTVRGVLRLIKCSPIKAKLFLITVNGEKTQMSRRLRDGDVIGFFSPMSGG